MPIRIVGEGLLIHKGIGGGPPLGLAALLYTNPNPTSTFDPTSTRDTKLANGLTLEHGGKLGTTPSAPSARIEWVGKGCKQLTSGWRNAHGVFAIL